MGIPTRMKSLASIVGLALLLPIEASAAKDLAEYPLRVHIIGAFWRACPGGFNGWGHGNIEDGQSIRAFDYGYQCSIALKRTIGTTYAGKWKKAELRLELLAARIGEVDKYDECELKTTMQAGVYVIGPRGPRLLTQEDYSAGLAGRGQPASPQPGDSGTPEVPPAADKGTSASSALAPEKGANMTLAVTSSPDGAEIEVDGSFMGSTPSSIELPPGEHLVVVRKPGFKAWERKLKLTGGDIRVNADLERDLAK